MSLYQLMQFPMPAKFINKVILPNHQTMTDGYIFQYETKLKSHGRLRRMVTLLGTITFSPILATSKASSGENSMNMSSWY